MKTSVTTTIAVGFVLMLGARARSGDHWPQFRGPTGLGYTDEEKLPLQWSKATGQNVRWQSPLVGDGHASPIVWDERVFVCTARWPGDVRQREKVIPEHHVLCYRATDGQRLWDTLVPPGPWLRTDFRSGPGGGYACPTPVTDGGLVYCAFGSSVLAALDFEGRIVWRKEIVPSSFDVTWGSSPILYGDTLILLYAMAAAKDSALVALDKQSGAERWRRPLPETGFAHSTPLLITAGGQPQLLVAASAMGPSPQALQAFDPNDGTRLWWCRGAGETSSPAYGAGLVYFDTGRGGPGVAAAVDGRGDVSATHVRWSLSQVSGELSSPVILGPHMYRLTSPNVLKSWRLTDGQPVHAERLSGLSSTWASPVVDPHGRLYFANAGKSFVIQTGDELKVLAVNDLEDGSHPSPAVAHGCLYLVGAKQVHCVGAK